MRTALFNATFLLWLCVPAMASKTTPPTAVHIQNETTIPVEVFVRSGGQVLYDDTMEPGHDEELVFQPGSRFNVAVSATPEFGLSPDSRPYDVARSCFRIKITTEGASLRLSEPMPCTAEEPPPDPPLPEASAARRESLLAALSSSGLLALALVGLLINRHE
jgi:hypothetical protein